MATSERNFRGISEEGGVGTEDFRGQDFVKHLNYFSTEGGDLGSRLSASGCAQEIRCRSGRKLGADAS